MSTPCKYLFIIFLAVTSQLLLNTGITSDAPAVISEAVNYNENLQLPYRFLLVISDQWQDPASTMIEEEGEFRAIVTLLKTWGLPFDILRLDQQHFDRYHLTDREGVSRYSTIIWDAEPSGFTDRDLSLLSHLVLEQNVGLVIMGNTVAVPALSGLAGLTYHTEYRLGDHLAFTGEHFITRAVKDNAAQFNDEINFYAEGSKVTTNDAEVLARRGQLPFLTVREVKNAGRVAWLGASRSKAQLYIQLIRDLLKRTLVWANGYAVYAEYKKSMLLFMDDIGTSDRTYLPYWHYRTLNETDIRENIIGPLKKHGAVLNVNVLSGYVDRRSHRIVSPWKQKVIDELDGKTVHDYVSAKIGLDIGVQEGVLEIQCHGYTHMLPDLESPPGPFWTAPMDGEGTLGFDYEFGDPVRGNEIPAITQKFLLARGIEYIMDDFGVRPLFVINGGHAWSRSYPNNSARIAAQLGFGLSHFNLPGYLGRDLVIPSMDPVVKRSSWQYDEDISGASLPWSVDAPYFLVFHDRDVSMDARALDRLLKSLGKDVRYLSANEYCGYLHAQFKKQSAPDLRLSLTVTYDDHYCQYFKEHDSFWIVHVSDGMKSRFNKTIPEKQTIRIPKGTGVHLFHIGG